MPNHSHTPSNRNSVRQPVLLGLFAGTAIGTGFLLAGVPNVELMTLVVALCGGALGARAGLAVGFLSAVVYSLGSPYGLPVPLMLAAQAVGLAGAGGIGALSRRPMLTFLARSQRGRSLAWAVGAGLLCTLFYDLLTNLAIVWAWGMHSGVVFAGAVPFFLIHSASNGVIFGALMPLLLPRLDQLRRPLLVANGSAALLVALIFLAPLGAADGVRAASVPEDPGQEDGLAETGWKRPLWTPFARTSLEWLEWYSPLLPVVDGGLGAPAVVLGEAGSSLRPLYVRDGIPLGTGHFLTDDPSLVPTAGLVTDEISLGPDGWGGSAGLVASQTADLHPEQAASAYRGVKGRHESYFRSIHLLTPKAAWRAAFEFEESLDIEGYNFTDLSEADFQGTSEGEFPGHSRIRQSRARLFRQLDADNRLVVEYSTGRLTKDSLPAYGAEHLELWDTGLAASMSASLGRWRLDSNWFWRNDDVVWGDRSPAAVVGENSRHLDVGREGVDLILRKPSSSDNGRTALRVQASRWHLDDTLASNSWLSTFEGEKQGTARILRFSGVSEKSGNRVRLALAAGADWHSEAGLGPEAEIQLSSPGDVRWWSLQANYGGRAPRSDELLTPLRRDVAGRRLILWPNSGLRRERTARIGVLLASRLLGFDLALDSSVTRLRRGITWRVLPDDANAGRWANDLSLDGVRIAGRVGREGRLAGWARATVEGIWQNNREVDGRASFLPPERLLRTQLMWENHFFKEDGILQIALFSTARSAMSDPWDVTRTAQLPVLTKHDLIVGFRLLGADLSLAVRNLTGERMVLTSGARSPAQEIEMRLHWAWIY